MAQGVRVLMEEDPDKLHEQTQAKIEDHKRAMVEARKLEFEIHKTQATLVTGSLVAVIALSELLLPENTRYTLILVVSCVLLLFSMGWTLSTMLSISTAVMVRLSPFSGKGDAERYEGEVERSRRLSMLSFPVGLGLFAVYVYLNRFL